MVATMVYCCYRHCKDRPDYGSHLATPQQQGTQCSGKYVSKSEFYGMGVGCCYCQRCGEFMMFLVDRLVQEAGMQQSDRKWKKAKKEAVINNKISRVATSIQYNVRIHIAEKVIVHSTRKCFANSSTVVYFQ